jgi:hypothetical protein
VKSETRGLKPLVEPIGAVAQLGEHLLCKQGVVGSNPISSTNSASDQLTAEGTTDDVLPESRHGSIHAAGKATAMTCGQKHQGQLPAKQSTARVAAER